MCIKCNIFNSILIFVSNIWGLEPYFWDFLFILIFVPNTWEVETYFWEMCTTQCFSFYPDIRATHLGGRGVAIYFWDVYKTHCKDRMVNVN